MYRLYGALAVLGVIIAIGIGAFFINTNAADSLSEKLRSAYSFAEAGDMVRSAEKMHEAVNYMDKKSSILCMFVSHKILDDIRQETDKAQVYLGQGEKALLPENHSAPLQALQAASAAEFFSACPSW